MEKEIRSLEIEKEAIKNEKEKKERREELEKELNAKKGEYEKMEETWKENKKKRDQIQVLRDEILALDQKASDLEMSGNYQEVAQIRYAQIPEKTKKLETLEQENGLDQVVRSDDIANIIGKWTGIPVGKLLESESAIYANLENALKETIIGQTEAVEKVSNALRRNKAGLGDPNRPIGSFLFLGPTGVGKTETAKALCRVLWNNPDAYVRLDMSEYMESHSVSRLIGSPPGYIGHDEGGQLTEAVRRHPYSVILLDEVEKAHPDIWNIFLQILDEGQLTDSKGRTVNMKNTIIIMTSNLGSDIIANNSNKEKQEELLRKELKKYFRIEFLNRIDDTIVYHALCQDEIKKIAALSMKDLQKRFLEKHITLEWSESLESRIAQHGYDSELGARPLKRVIREYIINPLSQKILQGEINQGDYIHIDLDQNLELQVSLS
ncbi:hypothetical protein CSB09_04740 [Candidatus Gracilibacteria bacterium]|nr:MAG: hypothetical protein CSB09_04740 [Candidatus Gracilibacteria bacterium]